MTTRGGQTVVRRVVALQPAAASASAPVPAPGAASEPRHRAPPCWTNVMDLKALGL